MKKIIILIIILLFPISVYALEYPKLDSKSVEVYDITDKKVLYEKNSNEISSIASLTKIATIITAIENIENLDQNIIITNDILKTVNKEASKAGLKAGDQLTYKDLLYASMLPSGADATNAIAILSSGSIGNFTNKMNNLAGKLGLAKTNFVNVTGLDETNNYSTADNVTKLLTYALKNPIFKKIYNTKSYTLSNGLTIRSTLTSNYYNSNYDITKIVGSKTGYTKNAGYCLSSLSNINNHEILIISLKAKKEDNNFYHIIDTVTLINYIEKNYKERILIKKNTHIKNIKVNLSNIDNYEVKSSSDVTKYLPSDFNKNSFKYKYEGLEKLNFRNKKGEKIGKINYYYDNKIFYKEDVVLNQDLKLSIIRVIKKYWYIFIFMIIIYTLYKKIRKKSK